MRIAFVSQVTTHHRETESCRRIRGLARRLANRGHDVAFFCSQWWEGDLHAFEHDDIDYRALADEDADSPSTQFALRLPFALFRFKPDVIHGSYPPGRHVMGASLGGTLARAPLLVDWYGDGPTPFVEYEATPFGKRRAARSPDTVVTPSRMVKTAVREAGAADEAVEVIPNSIDFGAIREAPVGESGDIVYSRRLDGDANVESLLLALAEFRDRDWGATIIGDGPEREGYERQARDLRIDDRVEFVGDLSVEERISLFKGAHVYVQTARRESFPTDLLRALACGCAGVVEYQVESSAHELVEKEPRGFRTTSDDELVDAIRRAGELPRMEINEDFASYDHRAILERYLDCYRDARDEFGLL